MTLSGKQPVYATVFGAAYCGDSRKLLDELPDESVNLVMTSPPFALQRKKEYGNKDQSEYIEWLAEFARIVHRKLRDDGSFVLDLGGAYRRGVPARSLYNFRVLIHFCDEIGLVRTAGFEPAVSWSPTRRDTRLRHVLIIEPKPTGIRSPSADPLDGACSRACRR
jgi:hypothetical protein